MGYLLEIKTIQTGVIKVLIEALKEILTDTNIEINQNGIKIMAIDSTKTVLVHLQLKKENFEFYECKKRFILGLNMLNLFKIIRTVTNSDTLTFYVDENNENKLGIRIDNKNKKSSSNYKLKLMDLNVKEINMPDAEFNSVITMPSSDFQKLCRDMHNLSDTIEIKSIGSQLIFSCTGDIADQETIFAENNKGMKFKEKSNNMSEIIQGYYNLKYLVLFTKCTNLCNNIDICIKNNFPIIIIFQVGNLGKLELALAPKENND